MIFSTIKTITIPEGAVKKITVGGAVLWEEPASYKNWVFYSTEADGETIYNGGKGYKDGYRIRSGGAEAQVSYGVCTGYIPYKQGDKLYIYPPFTGENTVNAINFYDSAFNCLGQVTDEGNGYGFCNDSGNLVTSFKTTLINGVSVLDISAVTVSGVADVAHVRVTHRLTSIQSGAEMIITKNEEIPT